MHVKLEMSLSVHPYVLQLFFSMFQYTLENVIV